MTTSRRFLSCLAGFFLLFSLNGCIFKDLKKELGEMEDLYVLRGNIAREGSMEGHIFVVAYQKTSEGIRFYKAVIANPESSDYSVIVEAGTYFIAAFSDQNEDLSHDKSEPAGFYGKPSPVEVPAAAVDPRHPKTVDKLDISISKSRKLPPGYHGNIALNSELVGNSIVKIGELIDFDDPIMAGEYGAKGYWKPLTFLREVGIGVFFLQEYDPKKFPVLFVHGAVGTPLGWRETVDWIDTDKYQPWFYYYPSGLPLERLGNALNNMIDELHRRHGFKRMVVVAQSMGGLVARSFILKSCYESNQTFIDTFISISTPWNGHIMSQKGVEQAPTAVPSWYDMVPESSFIQSIFSQKLPERMKYYLFASFKGDCSLFLANNDGTVELASELDYRAQAEADKLFALDEDHGSIVFSNKYLTLMHELLGK